MSPHSGTSVLAMPRLPFNPASSAPASPSSRPTRSPQRPAPSSSASPSTAAAAASTTPASSSPATAAAPAAHPTGFDGAWLTPPHPRSAATLPAARATPGLLNLGNTCFLNAALQCLLHLPPLAAVLLHAAPHRNAVPHARFCPYCALRALAALLYAPPASRGGASLSPSAFARNTRTLCPGFRPGRQEDAHEFVRGLLDAMTRAETSGCGSAAAPRWDRELAADVHRVFGGALQSRVLCTGCRHASVVSEPFLDLSLEIARASSVERALARFTQAETLAGENRYRCDKCRNLVVAQKRFSVRRAPNVLTLHLKRFDRARKDCRFISFPQRLDIADYMIGKPKADRAVYELTGVLVHQGTSRQYGHYLAYVKGPSGAWLLKDDSTSRTVPVGTVLKQKAYLLFYCRVQDSRSPSSPPSAASPDAKPSKAANAKDTLVELSEESSDDETPPPTPKSAEKPPVNTTSSPGTRSPASSDRTDKDKGSGLPAVARKVLGPLGRRLNSWDGSPRASERVSVDTAEVSGRPSTEETGSPDLPRNSSCSAPTGSSGSGSPSSVRSILIGGGGSVRKMVQRVFGVQSPSKPERKRRPVGDGQASAPGTRRASNDMGDGPGSRRESRESLLKIPKLSKFGKKALAAKQPSSPEQPIAKETPVAPVEEGRPEAQPKQPEAPPPQIASSAKAKAPPPQAASSAKVEAPPPQVPSSTKAVQPAPSALFGAEGVDTWDNTTPGGSGAGGETRHKSFSRSRINKRRRANDSLDVEYDRGKQKKARTRFGAAGGSSRNAFDHAAEGRRRA